MIAGEMHHLGYDEIWLGAQWSFTSFSLSDLVRSIHHGAGTAVSPLTLAAYRGFEKSAEYICAHKSRLDPRYLFRYRRELSKSNLLSSFQFQHLRNIILSLSQPIVFES